MGGSVKRSPENLAARAQALRRAAEAMEDPPEPPFGLLNGDLRHAAAVDEVRRAKASLLRRADALWAECGRRYLARDAGQPRIASAISKALQ